MPCRHERPLGWPSADGAGSPGRRDRRPGYTPGWPLDPHRLLPVEPTNPGQRTVCFCQFGLACLVSAGRRADAARLAHPPKESLAPTSVGPWAVAAACREGRQAMSPVCPGGWCFVWGAPAERLDAGEALPPHCHAVRSLQPPLAARRARRGRAPPSRRRGRAGRRRLRRPRGLPQAAPGLAAPPPWGCRRARRRATHELGAAAASATTRRRSCTASRRCPRRRPPPGRGRAIHAHARRGATWRPPRPWPAPADRTPRPGACSRASAFEPSRTRAKETWSAKPIHPASSRARR
jgi:hypothetical protein